MKAIRPVDHVSLPLFTFRYRLRSGDTAMRMRTSVVGWTRFLAEHRPYWWEEVKL